MEWKSIVGYEGQYEVSNTGEVRSLDRITPKGYKRKGAIMKPAKNNKGYFQVSLVGKDGKKQFLVHRLVAIAFLENADNLPVVNHIDECPTNNHVSNLEWVSQSRNMLHTISGERHPNAKLKSEEIPVIRDLYDKGDANVTDLAKMYNVSRTSIWYIVQRKTRNLG